MYIKNCFLMVKFRKKLPYIFVLVLCFHVHVDALDWHIPQTWYSPHLWVTMGEIFAGRIIRPTLRIIDRQLTYAKTNPKKTKLIIAAGVAALAMICWRSLKNRGGHRVLIEGLSTTDPHLFCTWAEEQLNRLDAKYQELESAVTNGNVFAARINQGYRMADAIRIRLCELRVRSVGDRYDAMQSLYQATAEKAPLLEDDHGVKAYLGLPPHASYDDFERALADRELRYAQDYPQGKAPADLTNTLRQLHYIGTTPFGWANYCAYVQGPEAVGQLPCVEQDRIEALIGHALQVRANYDTIRPPASER